MGGASGEIPAYLGTYSSVMLEKQVCHADGTGVLRRWHGCAMPMTWVCHQRGTEVLFIQRLLDIGDDIIGVLDTYREAD